MKLIEQILSNGKDEKNIVPWKYSRYLLFVKYITLSKVMNLLRSLFFWFFNIETINSCPVFLRIEISRMCHVNCLYCSEPKENRFYPFEKYSTLINLLKKYIVVIQLYEIGQCSGKNRMDFKFNSCNQSGSQKVFGTYGRDQWAL